jgi:hypothetical protein
MVISRITVAGDKAVFVSADHRFGIQTAAPRQNPKKRLPVPLP